MLVVSSRSVSRVPAALTDTGSDGVVVGSVLSHQVERRAEAQAGAGQHDRVVRPAGCEAGLIDLNTVGWLGVLTPLHVEADRIGGSGVRGHDQQGLPGLLEPVELAPVVAKWAAEAEVLLRVDPGTGG